MAPNSLAKKTVFPQFLQREFDEASLDDSRASFAALSPAGTILWVNAAWKRREASLGARPVVGTSYFDGITPPLRESFEDAFSEVLSNQEVFELDYECPTPEEQRTFRLRALPIGHDGLLVEHTLVVSAPVDARGELGHTSYVDADGLIKQCSNCRRVHHPVLKSWHFVPELVANTPKTISHGLCPPCAGYILTRHARRRR